MTGKQWIEVYSWLASQPAGKARDTLFRLAASKVRVKPTRTPVRLPRGVAAKVKKTSIPKLKKELDRVFSIYTRQKDCDDNGRVACVTCGKVYHWKDLDAGHYQPRQDLATRWEPRNVWPQCRPDNAFRGGEPEKMAAYIDLTCGRGVAESLRAQARQSFKLSRSWLEYRIAHFKALIHD